MKLTFTAALLCTLLEDGTARVCTLLVFDFSDFSPQCAVVAVRHIRSI